MLAPVACWDPDLNRVTQLCRAGAAWSLLVTSYRGLKSHRDYRALFVYRPWSRPGLVIVGQVCTHVGEVQGLAHSVGPRAGRGRSRAPGPQAPHPRVTGVLSRSPHGTSCAPQVAAGWPGAPQKPCCAVLSRKKPRGGGLCVPGQCRPCRGLLPVVNPTGQPPRRLRRARGSCQRHACCGYCVIRLGVTVGVTCEFLGTEHLSLSPAHDI